LTGRDSRTSRNFAKISRRGGGGDWNGTGALDVWSRKEKGWGNAGGKRGKEVDALEAIIRSEPRGRGRSQVKVESARGSGHLVGALHFWGELTRERRRREPSRKRDTNKGGVHYLGYRKKEGNSKLGWPYEIVNQVVPQAMSGKKKGEEIFKKGGDDWPEGSVHESESTTRDSTRRNVGLKRDQLGGR